ncbi:MAG TPA: DNA recombination protein RmuC [Sutterella sp.]|nr:DNA recombination protein RmuC [Sutterella sp.]
MQNLSAVLASVSPEVFLIGFGVLFLVVFIFALLYLRGSMQSSISQSVAQNTTEILLRENQRLREELANSTAMFRNSLHGDLDRLRSSNEERLEAMRRTVDEKLQKTLDDRFGSSFKLVNDELLKVQEGLGKMHQLAEDVGSLKSVLSGVKTRGIFGEIELQALLEDVLSPGQFEANVKPVPQSNAVVEFAVKLPGPNDEGIWLPIDSKFPLTHYERLLAARQENDQAAIDSSLKALTTTIKTEAKDIHDKYIKAPFTTEFAILFLATESLYAEILNVPGFAQELRTKFNVVVTGPTVLASLLNALRMGFRTLAISEQSEVLWKEITNLQSDFKNYAEDLAKARKQLNSLDKTMESLQRSTLKIQKRFEDTENTCAVTTDAPQEKLPASEP